MSRLKLKPKIPVEPVKAEKQKNKQTPCKKAPNPNHEKLVKISLTGTVIPVELPDVSRVPDLPKAARTTFKLFY